jgi:hypothetical protein
MNDDVVFNPALPVQDNSKSQSKESGKDLNTKNVVKPVENKISTVDESEPVEMLRKEAGSAIHFHGFSNEKKQRFLSNAFRYWPNVTRLCASVGITPSGYYQHTKLHPDFARLMKDIDVCVTDDVELVLRYEASNPNPKSFLDRMAYLRAHRPELYDRAKVVRVEGYKLGDGEARRRSEALAGAVEAQIVNAYTERKERQRAKREGTSLLPAVEQESGGSGDGQSKGE